jgi:hypothetical protein
LRFAYQRDHPPAQSVDRITSIGTAQSEVTAPAISLGDAHKEPAITVREPDATVQPTPQDIQLMSKHRVLSLKPQLRLEWRGQDGQNETEQPDHSASLGVSITSSTQIRFSVHKAITSVLNWAHQNLPFCA